MKKASLSLLALLFVLQLHAFGFNEIMFEAPYQMFSEGTTTDENYQLIDNNPDWTIAPFSTPLVRTVAYNGSDYLEVARVSGNSGSADVYYTGPDNVYSDFQGSVIFTGGDLGMLSARGFGPLLRAAGSGTSFSATNKYWIAVSASGGDRGLGIYYGGGASFIPPLSGSEWNTVAFSSLEANLDGVDEYLLTFSAQGPNMSASLFLLDSNGDISGPAIASVFTNQATERSEGLVGFRAGRFAANNNNVLFRDFQIIPEPSAVLFSLMALGTLLFGRRRKCGLTW